jgi:hypothetical protein
LFGERSLSAHLGHSYGEHCYLAAKEDFRRWKRQQAEDKEQTRTQAMADVQMCADVQAAYQPIFSAYGEMAPGQRQVERAPNRFSGGATVDGYDGPAA